MGERSERKGEEVTLHARGDDLRLATAHKEANPHDENETVMTRSSMTMAK